MYEKQGKITLLPHGRVQSSDASQNKLLSLLQLCGADYQRILDQSFSSMDRLVHYLSRIEDFRDTQTRAIVALTQTCPVNGCIIRTRQVLCEAFPVLQTALWIIFADPAVDPAFCASAERLGKFDNKLDESPVWEDPDGNRYLVLTPNTSDEEHMRIRARMLAAQNESRIQRREHASTAMKAVRSITFKP